ncbi:3-oxoadipate enol-lactonase [uncultured Amaricoccus sp.]|uniref:3-oxoadipate enol-lactonase n=1 Tax=uncultured Amaricoccus sp. TaxID=339341 RepID=UPI00261C4A44|nr:3-oxoadipate enol-lactonase [uncultured Amaricoccus sp.]
MRVITVNGLRVHHAIGGDPAGAPIVFANSLGTDLRVWDNLLPLLPPGLRVLRYDMRGHGLTDAPDGAYFMGDLVADAAALMEATGFRNAVFVGLSIGGVVAQGLAAERPDLVRAAVLSNTAAKIGTEDGWNERIATVRANGIEAIADQVMRLWFTRGFHSARADELALWRNMVVRTPLDGYLGCCAAIADTDLRASTAGLRLPVLALVGDQDGSTPPDLVRETAESIAGARFEIIRRAGHIPCVEQPEATAALIARFLRDLG